VRLYFSAPHCTQITQACSEPPKGRWPGFRSPRWAAWSRERSYTSPTHVPRKDVNKRLCFNDLRRFYRGNEQTREADRSGHGIESVQFLWPIEGDGLAIMDTKTL
jgi:hypothetical protein